MATSSYPGETHVHDRRRIPHRPAIPLAFDEIIQVHLEFQIGAPIRVFEDVKPDVIELNLYPVPPRRNQPWWTLVTSGMSSAPMLVREPGRPERLAHAEVYMLLPPDWPLGDPRADEDHWPLSLLGDLARLPHAHDTWLGPGHVVANGSPPEPYSRATRFAGALVLPPRLPGWRFSRFNADENVSIEFLAVVPLLPDELDLARKVESRELAAMLDRGGVTEVLDPDRKSVASSSCPG